MAREYDIWDHAEEEWAREIETRAAEEAVRDFKAQRLRSYFEDEDGEAAVPFLVQFNEASSLLPEHPSASLVFAASALEIGITGLLLRPFVYGLTHSDGFAPLLSEFLLANRPVPQLMQLLLKMLGNHAGIDPKGYKRDETAISLWDEIQAVRERRNKVLHSAASCTVAEAEGAIAVTRACYSVIILPMVNLVGCHIHNDGQVCSVSHREDDSLLREV